MKRYKKPLAIKGREYGYQFTVFNDANDNKLLGIIEYLFSDGSKSKMSVSSYNDARLGWHGLCRINRARRNARNYLHIINHRMSFIHRRPVLK